MRQRQPVADRGLGPPPQPHPTRAVRAAGGTGASPARRPMRLAHAIHLIHGEARLSPQGDGADHCGTFRAVARRSGQAPRLDRDRRPMALDHRADLQ
jgi:hypothetical protein